MLSPKVLDEISGKISEIIARSPAKDLEKNLRALLARIFSRLDLVTREEFEVQREVLLRTREKLAQLEAKIAELEKSLDTGSPEQPSQVKGEGTPSENPEA